MKIPNIFRPILGWIFGLTILTTSLFGNYIITLFLFLVVLGQHSAWRHQMDRAISFWMSIPMGFLEFIFGMTVRVTGDEIDVEEPALIIMNHRTRLDWMYVWSMLYQINPWLITTNKISLKAQLRNLPGAGFGMAAAQFVFLERNMEKDKESFNCAIDYYKGTGKSYQLLLFPEGTDKSPWTTTKSQEYAKINGLQQLKHLLYPRTTGFYHLVTKMRQANYIKYIYDITIAYPHNIVQSEVDLVTKGVCPREVHFHIRRIPISTVPKEEAEVGNWLNRLWIEKEQRLENFYSEPIKSKRQFNLIRGEKRWSNERESWKKRLVKLFCFWFWIVIISICSYHVFFIWTLQVGFTYFFVCSLLLYFIYGGIDKFVYLKWRQSVKESVV